MKVAIITPFHQPDDPWLQQCIRSVREQTHGDCRHVLVGDGAALPADVPSDSLLQITLNRNIGDYGDSPRTLGAIYGFSLGADAVAFLDADNWFSPDHIESLVRLHQATGAPVVVSLRNLVSLDGGLMGVCEDSDGLTFCDTNCMFFTQQAADIATSWWRIPPHLHAIDDRVIWSRVLRARHPIARTLRASANYRTGFRFHYENFNKAVPEAVKSGADIRALDGEIARYKAEAESILKEYDMPADGRHLRSRSSNR